MIHSRDDVIVDLQRKHAMNDNLLAVYGFNLMYAQGLVKDVADDQMAAQPAGVTNHAAWVIGHLARTCDFAGGLLGLAPAAPKEWEPLFGSKSKPVSDVSVYPGKQVLVQALTDGHARVTAALQTIDLKQLDYPTQHPTLSRMFPKTCDLITFITTGHEAMHLGQLSAWRRAMGMKSVF